MDIQKLYIAHCYMQLLPSVIYNINTRAQMGPINTPLLFSN